MSHRSPGAVVRAEALVHILYTSIGCMLYFIFNIEKGSIWVFVFNVMHFVNKM